METLENNIASAEELLTADKRNSYTVKTVQGTPFTIVQTEKNGFCILIKNVLIDQGYKTGEEAEQRILQFTDDWPFLTGTIAGLVKLILSEINEFNTTTGEKISNS